MATNEIYRPGWELAVACTHPTTPLTGQPCRLGDRTGVVQVSEDATSGKASVDFGPGVWDLSVKGVNDAGDSAVAIGDNLYYVDADVNDGTGFLSKKTGGRYFGQALEAVTSGATATINVAHDPGIGWGRATIPTGAIKTAVIAGGSAGNLTVTGIKTSDELVGVVRLDRDATAANINLSSLLSEFTITATDTINNTGGTATIGDALLIIYVDHTS